MAVKRMYCNDCQQYVLAERQPANHVLHLLLTIVSFGLWIIVWLLLSLSQEPWRCPKCVNATVARKSLISPDHSRLVRGSVAMLIVGVALFFASTKDKDSNQRQATGTTSISDKAAESPVPQQPVRSTTFRQAEQGQVAETTGPSEIPAGEYFVTAKVLNVRLCHSDKCPSPDKLHRRQKVTVYEQKDKWARISKFYDSSAEQLKFPEIVEPSVARWVAIEFLSKTEPSD